ncbi:cell envelope integrity protein CreD [Sphingobacterium sp. BN32]|uniref:cell envelope integrity protein CreD n=1 Tax=Sphingobacterium sp. BN32 TaxID=3058432 RepID=UPI00265D12B5|nr:cell envelope integrity protein CreD [Sphingobacterium sp. BN32]WKK57481.1 cell envelope integrity protein CreD [Sphingobacterium sp. BN32]
MENIEHNNPQEQAATKSIYDRVTGSVVLKFGVVFFLTLILLIPMNLITDLIYERKYREQSVSNEIAVKWGKEQVIASPIIVVPYDEVREVVEESAQGVKQVVKTVVNRWAQLLPDEVQATAEVSPEPLKRGIYQAVVYSSKIKLKGKFVGFDMEKLDVSSEKLKWNEAKLIFGVHDVKGLTANPTLNWGGTKMELGKSNYEMRPYLENLIVDLPLSGNEDLKKGFELDFDIRGSRSLNFLPLAKQTDIDVKGNWSNPSFNGGHLPESRDVTDQAFAAKWSIPSFSRKLPQQWTGGQQNIYEFLGVDLNSEHGETSNGLYDAIPATATSASVEANAEMISSDYDMVQINFLPSINNYQKTTRVTKYGILVIALTFVSLLFMEIIKKQRVHIIQYVLIGFAMVLFYALLLAISEHLGFNIAYLLAALATILLIASFVRAITKNMKSALIFGAILSLFYVFIYILMQLRDYSLIVGTIGVFIILAALMRLSTKIDWYQFDKR